MLVDVLVSVALYQPLGIAGLVIGTVSANIVMTGLQLYRLRTGFNGRLEGAQTMKITARILAATVIVAALARGIWGLLDNLLGRSLPAELFSVGLAVVVASVLYAWLVLAMKIPEARQIEQLILGRLRRA